jgi:hypothetical protein
MLHLTLRSVNNSYINCLISTTFLVVYVKKHDLSVQAEPANPFLLALRMYGNRSRNNLLEFQSVR